MKTIQILSLDMVFGRMLALELEKEHLTVSDSVGDIILMDIDGFDKPEGKESLILTFGYSPNANFIRPFEVSRLINKLKELTEEHITAIEDNSLDSELSFADEKRIFYAGQTIELTPREYTLLRYLFDHRGSPVSRYTLTAAVWGREQTDTNVTEVYIRYLRQKLETDGRRLIFTVRGKGYMLK